MQKKICKRRWKEANAEDMNAKEDMQQQNHAIKSLINSADQQLRKI